MTRTYISHPSFDLETPIGKFELTPTDDKHIYVTLPHGSDPVMVNKVPYHVSAHFYLYGTEWNWANRSPTRNAAPDRYNALFMRRADRYTNDHATNAAQDKLESILLPLVQKWADDHKSILNAARQNDINNKLYQLEKQIAEATKTLDDLNSEHAALLAKLV